MKVNISPKYKDVDYTYSELKKHINSFWPENHKEDLFVKIEKEKIVPVNWRVVEIAPTDNTGAWVYCSLGNWEVTKDELYENGRYGLEFIIISPNQDRSHVESLAMLTFYHSNPKYRIKLGDTVNIGGPWMKQSTLDHFLISLPYPFSADLETKIINDIYVSFWWLIPITKEEAIYANSLGPEKIELIFEIKKLDYLNLKRESLV